jgi:DNA-binding transcriptional regulator YiaG
MRLIDWMREKNLSDGDVATLVGGVSTHAVKKWKYGERVPRRAELQRLDQVSDGQVTPNDFVLAAAGGAS